MSHDQIKLIEQSYRNRLAHNAIIKRGSFLLSTPSDAPFIFRGEEVGIYVPSLNRLVSRVWMQFPRERIAAWEKLQPDYQKSAVQLLKLSDSDDLLPDDLKQLKHRYERARKKAH